MFRHDGKISMTEKEVRCLFERLFDGPIPEGEDIETAGTACVFYIGVECVEDYLRECREKGLL